MDAKTLKEFQTFIYTLLSNFMSEKQALRYVDQDGMNNFIEAFTHKSVNPAVNYERMETLGDAMLKAVFPRYVIQRFENIDSATINNLNSTYMAKAYQGSLSDRLGFRQWIRTPIRTLHIREDAFESFVGALLRVSDLKDNEAIGYINIKNFIIWLFKDIKIDLEDIAPKKTFIDQTFKRLNLGKAELIFTKQERGNWASQLQIDLRALNFFASKGIDLPSNLGVGSGKTQTETSVNTYDDAYKRLKSAGINLAWVEAEKDKRDKSDPRFREYIMDATLNAKKLGFDDIYFVNPITTETEAVVNLLGYNSKTNEEKIIYSVKVEKGSEFNARVELLKRLAEAKV